MVLWRSANPAPKGVCKVYPFARHLCYNTDVCLPCAKQRRFKFKLRHASILRGRARNPEHD